MRNPSTVSCNKHVCDSLLTCYRDYSDISLGITFIIYAVDSVLMKLKVRLFGDVAEMVGSKHTIELKDDSTILTLTNQIQRNTGHSRGGYLGEFKVGGPDLAIMINGKNIELLDGVQTKLCEEDDIVIMPFVVGG